MNRKDRTLRRGAAATRGATLLEVVLALSVLVVALVGLLGAMVQMTRLREMSREKSRAYNAVRSQIERMRNERVSEVYSLFNSNPDDDPGGAGTAPGSAFEVRGLAATAPGLKQGRILFPEAGEPRTLREDVREPDFGMERGMDLNRDGRIEGLSRALDYRILPFRLVVEWNGAGGPTRLEVSVLLTQK